MTDRTLFFRLDAGSRAPTGQDLLPSATPGFSAELWQPRGLRLVPPGRFTPPFLIFAAMHALHLFGTRAYAMIILRDQDRHIAHSSMVFPPFARFPFMAPRDLQIGATFTRPADRGKGLALRAIEEIVARFHPATETFWYLTDESNTASQAVIRKAGFAYAGSGSKRPRFGLRSLGYYSLDSVPPDDQGFNSCQR